MREREKAENQSLSRESLSSCKGIWMSQCINEAISSLIHKGFVNVCALSAKCCLLECGDYSISYSNIKVLSYSIAF